MNRPTLVVAGISVRALAESARQGGWQVIGLDAFGDLDTRRACVQWHAIGEPAALAPISYSVRAEPVEAQHAPQCGHFDKLSANGLGCRPFDRLRANGSGCWPFDGLRANGSGCRPFDRLRANGSGCWPFDGLRANGSGCWPFDGLRANGSGCVIHSGNLNSVLDAGRLRSALAAAARHAGVVGWVAGGGFESTPALLAAGGDGLPLLGMGPSAVASLRDARGFFATLDRLGLAHPDVAFERPADPAGWLAKRAGGCGGSHIRPAAQAGLAHEDTYYQRVLPGVPMSALFLADGTRAQLIGLNRLIAHALGDVPYLYGGAIGPVAEPALQARVAQALQALVHAYALRGLGSMDFIAAQGVPWLLEVNPRPSASMVLYADAWPEGLVHAHLRALQGQLPDTPPRHTGVRGTRIVYAPHAGVVDAGRLAELPYCHDRPAGPARLTRGEPVCSVSAEATDVETVDALLAARCTSVAVRWVKRLVENHEETLS